MFGVEDFGEAEAERLQGKHMTAGDGLGSRQSLKMLGLLRVQHVAPRLTVDDANEGLNLSHLLNPLRNLRIRVRRCLLATLISSGNVHGNMKQREGEEWDSVYSTSLRSAILCSCRSVVAPTSPRLSGGSGVSEVAWLVASQRVHPGFSLQHSRFRCVGPGRCWRRVTRPVARRFWPYRIGLSDSGYPLRLPDFLVGNPRPVV